MKEMNGAKFVVVTGSPSWREWAVANSVYNAQSRLYVVFVEGAGETSSGRSKVRISGESWAVVKQFLDAGLPQERVAETLQFAGGTGDRLGHCACLEYGVPEKGC